MTDEQNDTDDQAPKLTGAAAEAERRRERAARQLRLNLQRRKAQVRARRVGAADERADGLLPGDAKPVNDD